MTRLLVWVVSSGITSAVFLHPASQGRTMSRPPMRDSVWNLVPSASSMEFVAYT